MSNVTVSVPEEMKHKMDDFEEINWSAVARQAFEQKIHDLEFIERFREDSELTEEDALRLGKEVNEELADRYETDDTGA